MRPVHRQLAVPIDQIARRLGVSLEAVQLTRDARIFDLHLDSFIPHRLWGYRLMERHKGGPLGRAFFGQADLPRLIEGGVDAAMWSITTNPFRGATARWRVLQKNLQRMQGIVEGSEGRLAFARGRAELEAAWARGAHGVLLSIQGGHALEGAPQGPASVPDRLLMRVTLIHLTSSVYGATSSPMRLLHREQGLTPQGRHLVEQLDAERVLVDLAHIHPPAFWAAVEAHDPRLPLIATHTGVDGVKPHWRNLDDDQLRAIAETGGTVGIIFQTMFLSRSGGPRDGAMVVEHAEHAISVVGEEHVSIGTDFDGAIIPPPDLAGADCWPRLVQHMLNRGWKEGRIRRILGENALRVVGEIRP